MARHSHGTNPPDPADGEAQGVLSRVRRLTTKVREEWRRFLIVNLIGLTGVPLSFALILLFGLIPGVPFAVAYVLQAFVSVTYSYAMNGRFAFGDRRVPIGMSLWRFVVSRIGTIAFNSLVFGGLVLWFGEQYWWAANAITLILASIPNYLVLNGWVFRTTSKKGQHQKSQATKHAKATTSVESATDEIPAQMRGRLMTLATRLPAVTLVIPVKDSQETVRDCIESTLAQDYAGVLNVIVVGSKYDLSWLAIHDYNGRVTIVEVDVQSPRRDSNVKRNTGLGQARTSVLALTDSDVVLPPDWISKGVQTMYEKRYPCVAGGMISETSGFLARYIDENRLYSKGTSVKQEYVVDASNFGVGATPPITAAVMFTRSAYASTDGLNPQFVHSYEDYEFFDRMTRAGHSILCTPVLDVGHYHRATLSALLRDYRRTGFGAADFVFANRDSRLAIRRRYEVLFFSVVLALVLATFLTTALLGDLPFRIFWVAAVASLAGIGLAGAISVRHLRGFFYPFVTALLGFSTWLSYVRRAYRIRRQGGLDEVQVGYARQVPRHELFDPGTVKIPRIKHRRGKRWLRRLRRNRQSGS